MHVHDDLHLRIMMKALANISHGSIQIRLDVMNW